MLYRKSIIAFCHYCSVETFQLLVINEINSSFGMGNLSSTSKSYWRVSKTINLFFFLSKGHWPYTRQSMSVNPPFLLLCFKDKEIWSLYFFCLRVIFLCFWQNTYSSVSDAILKCSLAMAIRQIDLFFFFHFISNGSQVWVMSTIKISLILARLVQHFSIFFFI